jgi:site-specific DNA recombinase
LHRRPVELEEFVALCERVGVSQVATVTADIDLGNDDGLFMARIFAAFAAKESGRKSARVRRKLLQNAEQGLPHGSVRPFGYEDDKITLRESEATVIREIVDGYLAGASIRSLTVWLNDSRIAPAAAKSWQTSAVRQILSSGRIAGLREHHGQVIGPAKWPAIITPAERDRVLARMAARSVTKTRAPRTYLLSGMLRCGRCGNRLYSQARHSNPDNRVRRYVCLNGSDHGGCGRLTVVAQPVEDLLTDAVLTRLDSPQLADVLAGKASVDHDVAALSARLDADTTRLDELAALYADGTISAREWITARDPITARIGQTRRDIAAATDTTGIHELAGTGHLLRDKWDGLDIDRQQAIIKSVLDHAVITPGTPGARSLVSTASNRSGASNGLPSTATPRLTVGTMLGCGPVVFSVDQVGVLGAGHKVVFASTHRRRHGQHPVPIAAIPDMLQPPLDHTAVMQVISARTVFDVYAGSG